MGSTVRQKESTVIGDAGDVSYLRVVSHILDAPTAHVVTDDLHIHTAPRIYAETVTKHGKYKNIRFTQSTCRYDRFAYSSAHNHRGMPRNVTQRNILNQYVIKKRIFNT